MRVDDFDYPLPKELIALRPAAPRDAARLLVVTPGAEPALADRTMLDLPDLLAPGDALVFNDTKVIPAELAGMRTRGGAKAQVSVTLTERLGPDRWQAMLQPRVWLLIAIYFTVAVGSNAGGAYFPTLIKEQYQQLPSQR